MYNCFMSLENFVPVFIASDGTSEFIYPLNAYFRYLVSHCVKLSMSSVCLFRSHNIFRVINHVSFYCKYSHASVFALRGITKRATGISVENAISSGERGI